MSQDCRTTNNKAQQLSILHPTRQKFTTIVIYVDATSKIAKVQRACHDTKFLQAPSRLENNDDCPICPVGHVTALERSAFNVPKQ